MMFAIRLSIVMAALVSLVIGESAAAAENPQQVYEWMKQLDGEWALSPADQQQGGSSKHPLVAPLVGTSAVAMRFKQIGYGSTVQEDLLPGTAREMMTMYHCGDSACETVKATHYCVKQNQPEMLASLDSTANRLVFDCDMSTDLCQSWDDHVHQISHQLSQDGQHLKTVYSSFLNGEHSKDSIYHFDRK
jgi:hypothetical protein